MHFFDHPLQIVLGIVLLVSSLGVICLRKPVHASLSFLLTLFSLALIYLQLHAEFIAIMQILVYAGAILVIFMYVVVLFQDSYMKIHLTQPQSSYLLIYGAITAIIFGFSLLGKQLLNLPNSIQPLPQGFGTVQSIGRLLYIDFFFPFEAVILLFLIAVVGAVYTARKGH